MAEIVLEDWITVTNITVRVIIVKVDRVVYWKGGVCDAHFICSMLI